METRSAWTPRKSGCRRLCRYFWRELRGRINKKKSVLLGKDATETSTKPTLALHGLCGSGVELPDKIHDAQLNLILSKIMNSFFSMSYEISRTHLYLKNYSLYTISSNLAGNLVLFFWLNIATLVCWPRSMSACSTAPSFLLYY